MEARISLLRAFYGFLDTRDWVLTGCYRCPLLVARCSLLDGRWSMVDGRPVAQTRGSGWEILFRGLPNDSPSGPNANFGYCGLTKNKTHRSLKYSVPWGGGVSYDQS